MSAADKPIQRVAILHSEEHEPWVTAAVAFADRGHSLRCVATQDLTAAREASAVLDLSTDGGAGDHVWSFTDRDGVEVLAGVAAANAVLKGDGTLEVHIRTRDRILARGQVKVRRRVGGTIASAMEALGPMLVIAATPGGDIPAPTVSAASHPPRAPHRKLVDAVAVLRTAAQAARGAVTCWRWSVAKWPGDIDEFLAGPARLRRLRWYGPRRSAFWADPHVVVSPDGEWLFVEDLDRSTGLGRIRATQFLDGELLGRDVVLANEHHLSFPQVYRVGERWLATVETCAARNPVYTFDHLGGPWREATDLPALPDHLADPVLVFDQEGRLTEAWGTDARLDPNAVFVRYECSAEGWQRVDLATEVDVTRTRGGGQLDLRRGLRAVQDCGETYGAAAEVIDLSDGAGGTRLVAADVGRGYDHRRRKGVHTVTWDAAGESVWIDGWYRRATLFGAVLRLREQRHSRECQG